MAGNLPGRDAFILQPVVLSGCECLNDLCAYGEKQGDLPAMYQTSQDYFLVLGWIPASSSTTITLPGRTERNLQITEGADGSPEDFEE